MIKQPQPSSPWSCSGGRWSSPSRLLSPSWYRQAWPPFLSVSWVQSGRDCYFMWIPSRIARSCRQLCSSLSRLSLAPPCRSLGSWLSFRNWSWILGTFWCAGKGIACYRSFSSRGRCTPYWFLLPARPTPPEPSIFQSALLFISWPSRPFPLPSSWNPPRCRSIFPSSPQSSPSILHSPCRKLSFHSKTPWSSLGFHQVTSLDHFKSSVFSWPLPKRSLWLSFGC